MLVNGSPIGFFNSSCGLKQVDLLFPFLFIIAMEVLSKIIFTLVNDGFMVGFLVGDTNSGTLTISHLLFTNDTLIFREAEQD